MKPATLPAPFTAVLAHVRRSDTLDFGSGWCGMEPTFTDRKAVRLWKKLSAPDTEESEDRFFEHRYMLSIEKQVAKQMVRRYRAAQQAGQNWCLFDRVEREEDRDQWHVRRQNLHFRCKGSGSVFTVRFGLDPETWEYSIKPVPLVWLYDPRFVRFLQELVFDVPMSLGLAPSIAHGGCQFSLSAKTYMSGSLLCDDIADKFNHPELSTWLFDHPNCDDRCFRATKQRRAAFAHIIDQYWQGAFHPRAIGTLTAENAFLDRGFGPAPSPPAGLVDRQTGPIGSADEVFQTNFAFGRAVRLEAQNVHPGYWQSAHPDSQGYRPDQIMRYSEGNLNRLRLHGELHVKSGVVLDRKRVPEFEAPLCVEMLYEEASWENRAQYGRTSARDFVEALLHDVHRAAYLMKHPGVKPRLGLKQDQLLGDAIDTLIRHGGGSRLDDLHRAARAENLEQSNGRIRSDFIEPETLFWAAWGVLPPAERAAIAREVVAQFVTRVKEADAFDPRRHGEAPSDPALDADPMEWHRHRVHPLLWQALLAAPEALSAEDPVRSELETYQRHRERYLGRRPIYSLNKTPPPWHTND